MAGGRGEKVISQLYSTKLSRRVKRELFALRSGLSGNFVQAILLGLLFVIGFVTSTLLVGKGRGLKR